MYVDANVKRLLTYVHKCMAKKTKAEGHRKTITVSANLRAELSLLIHYAPRSLLAPTQVIVADTCVPPDHYWH